MHVHHWRTPTRLEASSFKLEEPTEMQTEQKQSSIIAPAPEIPAPPTATDSECGFKLLSAPSESTEALKRIQVLASTQPASECKSSSRAEPAQVPVLDVIYIDFEPGDMHDPANWTPQRKWIVTLVACYFAALGGATASAYALGFPSMMRELGCTHEQAALGISTFCLGFGLVPLLTSSFSEEFGRRPLYVVCIIGFTAMYVVQAKASNIQTVIAARFLSGAFGSTGGSMVSGTVADIWEPARRGLPMSIYALSVIAGTGIGPVVGGWIELSLGWRWIEWFHAIAAALCIILISALGKETRTGVMLTRKAKKLRAETRNPRYRAKAEDERGSMKKLIWVTSTRPILLLLTEPTVLAFSLWLGFAWGILYSMFESIAPIFGSLYGFNQGQAGLTFVGITLGAFLGFATNFYQESLYRKHFPSRGPEARLYVACAAAVMFPAGMFIYAWCSQASIHWIVPVIGITLFMWATFIIYLAVFTYLADCYGTYASSALAGQSLLRASHLTHAALTYIYMLTPPTPNPNQPTHPGNLAGTAFPLFTSAMYTRLGYHWASSLFGFIAVAMIPIPYVLLLLGPTLRAKSRFASTIVHQPGQIDI
ncbi:MFS general substrate transporter [Mycena metata]|uniref:MFS general substrate transporter n=1 Tax=Mycena metata TaxID=1033252 RepID=A0AAD7MLB1_9AGAR|nr:MFS general substrate transporter [Mycena metata]